MAKSQTKKDIISTELQLDNDTPVTVKPKKDAVAKTKKVDALDIPTLPVSEEAKSMQYIDTFRKLGDEILIFFENWSFHCSLTFAHFWSRARQN